MFEFPAIPALVRRRRGHLPSETWYPPRRNVRPVENVNPQESPEPIHQGEATPSRPAKVQVYTAFNPDDYQGTLEFIRGVVDFSHPAHVQPIQIAGMEPLTERVNIRVPPHVAYGSLFYSSEPTHGLY